MKLFLRTLIACCTLAALTPYAAAQGGIHFSFSNGYYRSPSVNHRAHLADLQHRRLDRQIIHHNAHHYPMTGRQHGNLHDNLRHEAFHDRLEHRSAHRNGAYYYPYSSRYIYNPYGNSFGFGYSRPGISIRLGR